MVVLLQCGECAPEAQVHWVLELDGAPDLIDVVSFDPRAAPVPGPSER
jgi:hypothetical protein